MMNILSCPWFLAVYFDVAAEICTFDYTFENTSDDGNFLKSSLSLVSIWSWTCRDCVASVVELESESISTTLATQSRHVHDHMETRLYNTCYSIPLAAKRFKIFVRRDGLNIDIRSHESRRLNKWLEAELDIGFIITSGIQFISSITINFLHNDLFGTLCFCRRHRLAILQLKVCI